MQARHRTPLSGPFRGGVAASVHGLHEIAGWWRTPVRDDGVGHVAIRCAMRMDAGARRGTLPRHEVMRVPLPSRRIGWNLRRRHSRRGEKET